MVVREELSRARADLEERERGLVQCEAAIDASGTTKELQQQLVKLHAELDSQR